MNSVSVNGNDVRTKQIFVDDDSQRKTVNVLPEIRLMRYAHF